MNILEPLGQKARQASRQLSAASPGQKRQCLLHLALLLRQNKDALQAENQKDMTQAKQNGLDVPRLERLLLTPAIIEEMAKACEYVADLPDPVGALIGQDQRPNGILVGRMRVPLGVIAMIYESRPNVTIDASILCLKAGNAVILRGGSEAFHSNQALAQLLHLALAESALPEHGVQILDNTDRALVSALCKLDAYVDVIIPRGGEDLVRRVSAEATMPVLKHDKGVCHAFVDASADMQLALAIILNSKVQRPSACNALECLLVHTEAAPQILPLVAQHLGKAGCTFYADTQALPLMQGHAPAASLHPLDATQHLGKEFHSLEMAVCIVPNIDAALSHIAAHGSKHTEIICTQSLANAQRFQREADASMVGLNVSTRFNDGGELGLGAEIGISTSKLHAYGPMGVTELTTTKFVVLGQGQVR